MNREKQGAANIFAPSLLATAILASVSGSAGAATLVVDKNLFGEGVVLESADGFCSLIEAMKTMDNNPGIPLSNTDCQWQPAVGIDNFISLPVSATFTLESVNDYYDGPTGLPTVSGTVRIYGNGASIVRASNLLPATPAFRHFSVDAGGDLLLKDVTLSNGFVQQANHPGTGQPIPTAPDGGAIFNSGTLTLQNVTISNNSATNNGGGIASVSGKVTVDNSDLRMNTATSGGAIRVSGGVLEVINTSNIASNTADSRGGGVAANGAGTTFRLTRSTVSENSANSAAGVLLQDEASVVISDSVIQSNINKEDATIVAYRSANLSLQQSRISLNTGSGIHVNYNSSATISNTVIRDNQAIMSIDPYTYQVSYDAGTGIEINANSTAVLTGVALFGNSSQKQGGALRANQSTVTLVNSTVSGNTARNVGGILNAADSVMTLTNVTVSGNTATGLTGGNPYANGVMNVAATMTLVNSIIAGNPDGDCLTTGAPNLFVANNHNWFGDDTCGRTGDGDPRLGLLAINGGSTFTHALLEGSGAINAGDNGVCAVSPVDGKDQRGRLRDDGACDIGAYEFKPADPPPPAADSSFIIIPLPGGKTVIFSL